MGSLFKAPKIPDPPPPIPAPEPEPVMPLPDDLEAKRAARRSAGRRRYTGRGATILSDEL